MTSDEAEHMQIRHIKERIKGVFPLVCQLLLIIIIVLQLLHISN